MEQNQEASKCTIGQMELDTLVKASSSAIVAPTIDAESFQIDPGFIHLVMQNQFSGLPSEDPNQHIATFLEICDVVAVNGAFSDAIRLRLFPFSIRDKAKDWLRGLPGGSITTWYKLVYVFFKRFFPRSRISASWKQITSFKKYDNETLCEAWDRYNFLLRKCPWEQPPDMIVYTFYNCLEPNLRTSVDVASGFSFLMKTVTQARDFLETIATTESQWHSESIIQKEAEAIYDTESALAALEAKVDSLAEQLSRSSINMVQTKALACDFSAGQHRNIDCKTGNEDEQANKPSVVDRIDKLEDAITKFMNETTKIFWKQSNLINDLETQVGQFANMMAEGN